MAKSTEFKIDDKSDNRVNVSNQGALTLFFRILQEKDFRKRKICWYRDRGNTVLFRNTEKKSVSDAGGTGASGCFYQRFRGH